MTQMTSKTTSEFFVEFAICLQKNEDNMQMMTGDWSSMRAVHANSVNLFDLTSSV